MQIISINFVRLLQKNWSEYINNFVRSASKRAWRWLLWAVYLMYHYFFVGFRRTITISNMRKHTYIFYVHISLFNLISLKIGNGHVTFYLLCWRITLTQLFLLFIWIQQYFLFTYILMALNTKRRSVWPFSPTNFTTIFYNYLSDRFQRLFQKVLDSKDYPALLSNLQSSKFFKILSSLDHFYNLSEVFLFILTTPKYIYEVNVNICRFGLFLHATFSIASLEVLGWPLYNYFL